MNIEVILAVLNTTELEVEIGPEKIQAHKGFEPMTSTIPVQRSNKWANNHSAHIWFPYIYSHYLPFGGFTWNQLNDQLPVGLLAQVRTGLQGLPMWLLWLRHVSALTLNFFSYERDFLCLKEMVGGYEKIAFSKGYSNFVLIFVLNF